MYWDLVWNISLLLVFFWIFILEVTYFRNILNSDTCWWKLASMTEREEKVKKMVRVITWIFQKKTLDKKTSLIFPSFFVLLNQLCRGQTFSKFKLKILNSRNKKRVWGMPLLLNRSRFQILHQITCSYQKNNVPKTLKLKKL